MVFRLTRIAQRLLQIARDGEKLPPGQSIFIRRCGRADRFGGSQAAEGMKLSNSDFPVRVMPDSRRRLAADAQRFYELVKAPAFVGVAADRCTRGCGRILGLLALAQNEV